MKTSTNSVKSIMTNYIQDGSKTLAECFQAVAAELGLTPEFNILVCLEKIMENNKEIAEYNAHGMYGNSADFCTRNSAYYTRIQQELATIKNAGEPASVNDAEDDNAPQENIF